MKRFLLLALIGIAVWPETGQAQFDLPRQLTHIGNQVTAVLNQVNQYTAAVNAFIHLDCAAQGMSPEARSTPAGAAAVLCGTLDALGAFHDAYRDLADTPNLVGNILPATDWRAVLAAADTVREADIRTTYAEQPEAADRAAAAFLARRAAADRQVVISHARTDAASELTAALEAAEVAVDGLEARSPVRATSLGQTRTALTLARGELLAALARHKAWEAALEAALTAAGEVARRELETERQALRSALAAEWAQDRAALGASRDERLESLYGGFQLHPFFGGDND